MSTSEEKQCSSNQEIKYYPRDGSGTPMKPCTACHETRYDRDQCIAQKVDIGDIE